MKSWILSPILIFVATLSWAPSAQAQQQINTTDFVPTAKRAQDINVVAIARDHHLL